MTDTRSYSALVRAETGILRRIPDDKVLRTGTGLDTTTAVTLLIGTETASALTIGSASAKTTFPGDIDIDGVLTIVDSAVLSDGSITLGGGEGDVITLGGAYVSAV